MKHIYFDLDNTLWDFDTNSKQTLIEVSDEFKIESLSGVPRDYFITRYLFHNDRFWGLYRENKVSKSRLRSARFEFALRDVGLGDKRLAKLMGKAYLEQSPLKTGLNEGAISVLSKLQSAGLSMHILSNGFHEVQLLKLEKCNLRTYFNEVITSERANSKKPDPRIYEYAMRLTGSIPANSVMIGDHSDIDVIGALNCGWRAIHFNQKGEQHNYESISCLEELVPLLCK